MDWSNVMRRPCSPDIEDIGGLSYGYIQKNTDLRHAESNTVGLSSHNLNTVSSQPNNEPESPNLVDADKTTEIKSNQRTNSAAKGSKYGSNYNVRDGYIHGHNITTSHKETVSKLKNQTQAKLMFNKVM